MSGRLELPDGTRLSDVLNERDEVNLRQVEVVSHADGNELAIDELSVPCAELYAIVAFDFGGRPDRRIYTVRHRLQVHAGPYTILGHLHHRPGGMPLTAFGQRLPLVPLTGATIAFQQAGRVEVRDVDTLIVNRELADWVWADPLEMAAFLAEPVVATGA